MTILINILAIIGAITVLAALNLLVRRIIPVDPKTCKHAFKESDVYLADDPQCVYCRSKMSEIKARDGEPFEKKSIVKKYESVLNDYSKLGNP